MVTNDLLTYPQLVHVNTLLCVRALRALGPFWEWTLNGFTFISSMRFQQWYVRLRGRVSTRERFPLVGCPDDYLSKDERWLSRVILIFFNCAHVSCAHLLACVCIVQAIPYMCKWALATHAHFPQWLHQSQLYMIVLFPPLDAMDTNHPVVLNEQCTYDYLQTNQSPTVQ